MNFPLKQFWLLSIFRGMERSGLSPIHITDLNILYYYSNALAETFRVEMVEPILEVSEDFIFYPKLSFDIEKLEFMGLIKEYEPFYMAITRNGVELMDGWKTLKNVVDLNICVSLAYARNPDIYKHIFDRDPNLSLNLAIEKEEHDLRESNAVPKQIYYLRDKLKKKFPRGNDISLAINYYFQYLNG